MAIVHVKISLGMAREYLSPYHLTQTRGWFGVNDKKKDSYGIHKISSIKIFSFPRA
jgi:hypothetical protein